MHKSCTLFIFESLLSGAGGGPGHRYYNALTKRHWQWQHQNQQQHQQQQQQQHQQQQQQQLAAGRARDPVTIVGTLHIRSLTYEFLECS
ncbi:GH22461 [Drosophila grimshawi]|uniref:GH22461 n=1 Tax=Drosophila grimshawi TaxID=7222 RepID=B4K441_DROGR|nr:GH22461 [Drosophila grimshawi]